MTRATILFYVISIMELVAARLIAKRWCVGYFLGGLIFGLYNEVCYEFCWNYSQELRPMIWRDVPLIVILGWGLMTMLTLTLANRAALALKWKNVWLIKLLDVAIFFCFGIINEQTMSKLHFWSYNNPLQAELSIQIFGYIMLGAFITSVGRELQDMIDKKVT